MSFDIFNKKLLKKSKSSKHYTDEFQALTCDLRGSLSHEIPKNAVKSPLKYLRLNH